MRLDVTQLFGSRVELPVPLYLEQTRGLCFAEDLPSQYRECGECKGRFFPPCRPEIAPHVVVLPTVVRHTKR